MVLSTTDDITHNGTRSLLKPDPTSHSGQATTSQTTSVECYRIGKGTTTYCDGLGGAKDHANSTIKQTGDTIAPENMVPTMSPPEAQFAAIDFNSRPDRQAVSLATAGKDTPINLASELNQLKRWSGSNLHLDNLSRTAQVSATNQSMCTVLRIKATSLHPIYGEKTRDSAGNTTVRPDSGLDLTSSFPSENISALLRQLQETSGTLRFSGSMDALSFDNHQKWAMVIIVILSQEFLSHPSVPRLFVMRIEVRGGCVLRKIKTSKQP